MNLPSFKWKEIVQLHGKTINWCCEIVALSQLTVKGLSVEPKTLMALTWEIRPDCCNLNSIYPDSDSVGLFGSCFAPMEFKKVWLVPHRQTHQSVENTRLLIENSVREFRWYSTITIFQQLYLLYPCPYHHLQCLSFCCEKAICLIRYCWMSYMKLLHVNLSFYEYV